MCGIYGYSFPEDGILSEGQRAVLAFVLADENDSRGKDSAGFVRLDAGELEVRRVLGRAAPHAHWLSGTRTAFGHTRYATHGRKIIENAHPFAVGDVLGAHNGIIYNCEDLNAKYGREYEVDSVHLFAHLADGLPFDDVEGYGSIEWVVLPDTESVFLCRLSGGELSVAGIGSGPADCRGVVWSSDRDHLEKALVFAGVDDYFFFEVTEGEVLCARRGRLFDAEKKLTLSASGAERMKWWEYRDLEETSGDSVVRSIWNAGRKRSKFLDSFERDEAGALVEVDVVSVDGRGADGEHDCWRCSEILYKGYVECYQCGAPVTEPSWDELTTCTNAECGEIVLDTERECFVCGEVQRRVDRVAVAAAG